jgi:death-on-curing protein
MKTVPRFLSVSEVIEIHNREIASAGGLAGLRDIKLLESAVGAPQSAVHYTLLMDVYEMAATYANSIALNHPFIDGNKRTALASSLTFLFMNGFEVNESYEEELADKILALITRKISKMDFADFLRSRCRTIE